MSCLGLGWPGRRVSGREQSLPVVSSEHSATRVCLGGPGGGAGPLGPRHWCPACVSGSSGEARSFRNGRGPSATAYITDVPALEGPPRRGCPESHLCRRGFPAAVTRPGSTPADRGARRALRCAHEAGLSRAGRSGRSRSPLRTVLAGVGVPGTRRGDEAPGTHRGLT